LKLYTSFISPYRIIPTILFSVLLTPIFGQKDCDLKKDQDSIKVYTCRVDDLKFKSIKATFTINTTLSTLISFVMDIDRYNEWQYNTSHPRIVKKINDREMIYYTVVEAPWPISDRDMVVDLVVSQAPKTRAVTITTTGVPDYVSKEKNLVRVPMSMARWVITPISQTKLAVEYTIKIDPGGSVPAWMVNMVCAEAPYVSFRNLRQKIQEYKKHELSFIVD